VKKVSYGDPLTEKELKVLALVARGWTNAEIGRRMYMVEDTIKIYMRVIRRKLGARNRTEASTIAFCRGLLRLPEPGDEL